MNADVYPRPVDLAFLAAKKRQSPRTGFVHFFYGNDAAADTIPFYENICYAIALLHQKKTETVLEAKDLILRLLSFQTAEGNFPVYLHDYPRCFGLLVGLKALPLLLSAISFSHFVGVGCKEKIESSIQRILSFYEALRNLRPLPPLWEYRYQMCKAVWKGEELPQDLLDTSKFSATDWWEYWVTKQFQETPQCDFYHAGLQMCVGPFLFDRAQEGIEPSLALIDWICAERLEASRLTQDHPAQIGLAALGTVQVVKNHENSSHALLTCQETGNFNLLWKNDRIHSLFLEAPNVKVAGPHFHVDLPTVFELNREDLFEVAFYVDADSDVGVWINEIKGTAFYLGDWIQIKSSNDRSVALRFTLVEGEGNFCGHIFRSNRPNQRLTAQGESFDWKIGLRTLRRSEKCVLSVELLSSF